MELKIRQSELNAWDTCRRKQTLQYAQGWTRKKSGLVLPPSKADIGTIVHSGLEHYYRDGVSPAGWVTQEAARIEDLWAEPMTKEWKDAYNLAFIMLKGYTEWLEQTGVDAGWEITGVEREIEIPFGVFNGYDVVVTAHIDLEAIDALGRPILVDHKSVQGIGILGGPFDFQRLTYAVLRMIEDGTHYEALVHNELKRVKRTGAAKPPFYGRQSVMFNMEQLRKHHQTMQTIIDEITLHRGLPLEDPRLRAHPTKDCSWACPHFAMCEMVDDGSDWRGYLEDHFEQAGAHIPGEESN